MPASKRAGPDDDASPDSDGSSLRRQVRRPLRDKVRGVLRRRRASTGPQPDAAAGANDEPADRLARASRAALASLPVPEPGPGFWSHLDAELLEEPSLGVAARPAIRPITQMPGGVGTTGDKDLFKPSGRASRFQPPSSGSGGTRRRRVITLAVVVVLAGLLVLGSVVGGGSEDRGLTTDTTTAAGDDAASEPEPESEATTPPTPPPTPPPLPGLEASVPLTPGGVGPLQTGSMTLHDVASTVAEPEIDLPTFDGSAGICYDARLPGAPDLILRVRSPHETQGAAGPLDGVLSSITITAELGSSRETEVGIGLGSSEEQLLNIHAGELVASENPFVPGGHIYLFRAPDGSGNGIAYVTDGRQVREINVGAADVVRLPHPCG